MDIELVTDRVHFDKTPAPDLCKRNIEVIHYMKSRFVVYGVTGVVCDMGRADSKLSEV